jgi:hypothetical protein
MAAVAAALLSSATVFAAPPTADQVSVPQGYEGHHDGRMNALFSSPEERMMFKAQIHQATRGMSRDQKKAYRKQQIQQIKAMNDAQKEQWRQDLQAKWNAMPAAQQTLLAQKMERHAERHQQRAQNQGQYENGQQDMNAPQQ